MLVQVQVSVDPVNSGLDESTVERNATWSKVSVSELRWSRGNSTEGHFLDPFTPVDLEMEPRRLTS